MNNGVPPDPEPTESGRAVEVAVRPGDLVPDDASLLPTIPDHDLIRRIARGSYGEVWLARNRLGTMRAVKIVHRAAFEDSRPFEREFKGIQKFEPISRSHDGLVDILQVGGTESCFYYVMELADPAGRHPASSTEGRIPQVALPVASRPPPGVTAAFTDYSPRTLRSDMERSGRLPVADSVRVGLLLADALEHLHQHGLVHRDVKPSNIIFVNGAPKLADIGLVADVGEARSFVGTQGFIPPEGPGTAQADLYSLGKVLYEMATGLDRQEFPKLPPTLRELPDADALVEFNEIVLKACEDDPHRRYATARAMHDDLALLRAGKSIQRLRLVERRLAWFYRIGSVAAVLLVIAGGLYWGARAQAQATERQLYVAEMNLAYQAWDGGNLARARALLEKHRAAQSALRGFEWRLLDVLCSESDARYVLSGHTGIVWSVTISPDDTRAVTGGEDGRLRVWETAHGRLLTNLAGSTDVVHAVAWSPDGRTLASGGRDNEVVLRDAVSFKERLRLRQHRDAIRALAFSTDGHRLASGGEDNQVLIWDPADGRLIGRLAETMSVECLCFDPDGKRLAATGTDNCVHLWDLTRQESQKVAMQRSLLKAVAFSHDGATLAAAGYDGLTELWDVARNVSLGYVGSGAPVAAVAFSPDNQLLATAGADASIHLWSLRSRQRLRQLRGHTAGVNTLAFSRDGSWLASTSDDRTARVWEVQPGTARRNQLAHAGLVSGVVFAPNPLRLISASGTADELRVWDPASGRELATRHADESIIWSLAASVDGRAIFTGGVDGSLRRWDAATLQQTHVRQVHSYAIEAIAVAPDDRTIATACRGAPVKLWDAATLDAVATLPGEALVLRTVAFSPDGRWLAAGGRGPEVLLWNAQTRQSAAVLPGHAGEVRCVAFSPDSTTLAVAEDGRVIHHWDVASHRLLARLEGHDAPIKSLSFSPDGRTLASGSEDSTVKLWNLRMGQEVATLRGHLSQVTDVEFSPDGGLLASAGSDGMVRVWRAVPPPESEDRDIATRSRP